MTTQEFKMLTLSILGTAFFVLSCITLAYLITAKKQHKSTNSADYVFVFLITLAILCKIVDLALFLLA